MTTILHKLAGERGTALIELLVAIPSALAVFGAVAALSGVFGNSERANAARTASIETQQVAMARMTREIRQASAITPTATATPATTITLTVAGHADQVRYDCSGASAPYVCRRSSPPAAQPQGRELFTVTDPHIFTVSDGNYVSITASVDVPGHGAVTVSDGAALQNSPRS